jgi:hypothetical protein
LKNENQLNDLDSEQSSRNAIKFILHLPALWLLLKSVEASLLRSKNPEWFGLYSSQKLLAILFCLVIGVILMLVINKITINNYAIKIWNYLSRKIFLTFLVISILSFLTCWTNPIGVGEDISAQVKSSLQWHEQKVGFPNFYLHPDWQDLSNDKTIWSIRPPGASWIALPGLLFGMPIGLSIKFALFACTLIGGLGWLALCKRFKLPASSILIFAFLLSIPTGPSSTYFATTNILLFALTPWFLSWSINIGLEWKKPSFSITKKFLITTLFLLLLGSFSWVKLSGMIVAIVIGVYPIFVLIRSTLNIALKLRRVTIYILLGIFFWIPFLSLEKTTEHLTAKTSNQFYSAHDSDILGDLHGYHWKESTRGLWLVWGLIAGPGFALPSQGIALGVRDLFIQFEEVRMWLKQNKVNEHALFAGSIAVICTILIIISVFKTWHNLTEELRIVLISFLSLPFFGFAILSYKFGFNYLLYHAHTQEFSIIFLIPALVIVVQKKITTLFPFFITFVCIAIPVTSGIERITKQILYIEESNPSPTEEKLGLGPSIFSKSIKLIEEESNNRSDLLLFLPEGDMSDLVLRTKMRTCAIHFAGDNLIKKMPFKTAQDLTVYCAYPSHLANYKTFYNDIIHAFPQSVSFEKIHSEKIEVVRVKLEIN